MPDILTETCPSCNGNGRGPTGPYSPRIPGCDQCMGRGLIAVCADCGQQVHGDVCELCTCPDCGNVRAECLCEANNVLTVSGGREKTNGQ